MAFVSLSINICCIPVLGRWSKATVFYVHLLCQWWEAVEVMGAKALFLYFLLPNTCASGVFLVLILSLHLSTNALESSQTSGFWVCGFINTETSDPSNEQVNKNTQSYPRLADKGRPRSEQAQNWKDLGCDSVNCHCLWQRYLKEPEEDRQPKF